MESFGNCVVKWNKRREEGKKKEKNSRKERRKKGEGRRGRTGEGRKKGRYMYVVVVYL